MRKKIFFLLLTFLLANFSLSKTLTYSFGKEVTLHAPYLISEYFDAVVEAIDDVLKRYGYSLVSSGFDGEGDVIFGEVYSEDSSQLYVKFPVLSSRFGILKMKDFKGLPDRVGTLYGSFYYRVANSLFPQVRGYESLDELVYALKSGKVDGIFGPLYFLKSFIYEAGDDFVFSNRKLKKIYLFVKVKEPSLKPLIERAVEELYKKDFFEDLIERKRLKDVLIAPNHLSFVVIQYPPYEFYEGGEWKGTDVETVKMALGSLGFKVSFVTYPPSRAYVFLRNGVDDGAFSLEMTEDRMKFLDFVSEPLSRGFDVFFFRSDYHYQDFKKAVCGVVKGYRSRDVAEKMCGRVVELFSDESGIRMVACGRIDAFATNFLVGFSMIRKLGLSKDVFYTEKIREYYSYLALSKIEGLKLLKDEFSKALRDFKRSVRYDEILGKYGLSRSMMWLEGM